MVPSQGQWGPPPGPVGALKLTGPREELRLCALGLELLAQTLSDRGRAHPEGLDDLRKGLVCVLSRPEPSPFASVSTMAEGADVVPLLHTLPEAAERLRASRSTVERAVKTGSLRVVRLGRAARIRPADLESFVASLGP